VKNSEIWRIWFTKDRVTILEIVARCFMSRTNKHSALKNVARLQKRGTFLEYPVQNQLFKKYVFHYFARKIHTINRILMPFSPKRC